MTNKANNQGIIPSTEVIQLTLILKITTAQVVETSVTVNNNSPIQDYVHLDNQTQPTFEQTPGFKPFTVSPHPVTSYTHHTGKKGSKKKQQKKVTKNLLQEDSNPDPPNKLELNVSASIHWTTSVNADNSSLKDAYIFLVYGD